VVKRLLILAVTLSLMGTGQALCQTTHAATTIQDTGNASNGSSPATVPVSSTGAILTTAQQYLGYPYAYIGDGVVGFVWRAVFYGLKEGQRGGCHAVHTVRRRGVQ